MGAAAWFIIDTTEEFEFAKGADTNGDVYSNLIRLCNNENSVLISGAVIGQDTKFGNESKEDSNMKLLDRLVQSDAKMLAGYWNTVVCPALFRIGYLPGPRTFEFQQEEDLEKLWKMTTEIAPHKDVDNDWISEKFGIKVKDRPQGIGYQLNARQGEKRNFFA
jgi:phage gp29-like protein